MSMPKQEKVKSPVQAYLGDNVVYISECGPRAAIVTDVLATNPDSLHLTVFPPHPLPRDAKEDRQRHTYVVGPVPYAPDNVSVGHWTWTERARAQFGLSPNIALN